MRCHPAAAVKRLLAALVLLNAGAAMCDETLTNHELHGTSLHGNHHKQQWHHAQHDGKDHLASTISARQGQPVSWWQRAVHAVRRVLQPIDVTDKTQQRNHVLSHTPVAICTCAKDAWPDAYEWIQYHVNVLGIKRIYLYDNNSTVPMLDYILPFIQSGVVVYEYFSLNPEAYGPRPQFYAYISCIERYARYHKWLAMIDIDEFINVVHPQGSPEASKPQDLEAVLMPYDTHPIGDPIGGVAINWLVFGPDDNEKRPTKGVLASYRKCVAHDHVKAIVNTKYVIPGIPFGHPHAFAYKGGRVAVNTEKKPVSTHQNIPPSVGVLVLNHYVTKSREEYAAKMQRGSGDGYRRHSWDMFNSAKADSERANSTLEGKWIPCTQLADNWGGKWVMPDLKPPASVPAAGPGAVGGKAAARARRSL